MNEQEEEGAFYLFSYFGKESIPTQIDVATIASYTKYSYHPGGKSMKTAFDNLRNLALSSMNQNITRLICDETGRIVWRGRLVVEEWLL